MVTLEGWKVLWVGVADEQSVASDYAEAFRRHGADLAITSLNEGAEPFVRPLAEKPGAEIVMPLDVRAPTHRLATIGDVEACAACRAWWPISSTGTRACSSSRRTA